ncbi:hypothetical protein FNW52_12625 [Flavobacterium sp. ZT3R18]|uniref:ParB N-terminal domain-containing protein n=1 Tax=Flavobacterium sp. ZT3R18 TaxID=2594429 RepID=UPI00117A6D0E|nr:ParB N-terminal domain-containing protein [Flavobacterium sp. ZT3R18]TRX34980.1 hypothetical protein FNW52_12625 [Flavobacterium sp. ZT3R18]
MDYHDYYSIESQEKRINANKYRDNKKKEFKKILKSHPDSIKPYWHLSKEKIDFENLPEKKPTFIQNEEYEIYWIKVKELLSNLKYNAEKVYGKKSIWTLQHNDNKITKVLIHWQNEENLIPIILNIPEPNLILIQDGHHRLTVANFLDCEKIPVIISKPFEQDFLAKFTFSEKFAVSLKTN